MYICFYLCLYVTTTCYFFLLAFSCFLFEGFYLQDFFFVCTCSKTNIIIFLFLMQSSIDTHRSIFDIKKKNDSNKRLGGLSGLKGYLLSYVQFQ